MFPFFPPQTYPRETDSMSTIDIFSLYHGSGKPDIVKWCFFVFWVFCFCFLAKYQFCFHNNKGTLEKICNLNFCCTKKCHYNFSSMSVYIYIYRPTLHFHSVSIISMAGVFISITLPSPSTCTYPRAHTHTHTPRENHSVKENRCLQTHFSNSQG